MEGKKLDLSFARASGKAAAEELLFIAERASARTRGPFADHAEFLYDESGLPGVIPDTSALTAKSL